jgi:ubiquinone/menaquinone biosynthesis C-methylase UbiE
MTADHYSRAARRWAEGASLVYGPIAREMLAMSPYRLVGHRVLDVGAGTGVASKVLHEQGACPISADLSLDMLSWKAATRPPGAVADIRSLPLRDDAVDDSIAAFVLNHLTEPARGFAELIRVTRPGGMLLATVYSVASRSPARDVVDDAARRDGWEAPDWYAEIKAKAAPILGTAEAMARAATGAGLSQVVVDERTVDVGVEEPEQLVDYRLGQAHFGMWLDRLGPHRTEEVRGRLTEAVRPVMQPYRPIVVFLAATVPVDMRR